MFYFFKNAMNSLGVLFITFFFISCDSKIDRNDPDVVVKEYWQLRTDGNYKKAYELLSDTCRKLFSIQDYLKVYEVEDSLRKLYKATIISQEQMPFKAEFPSYRYYKIKTRKEYFENKDTVMYTIFLTLKKDSTDWSVIWSNILINEAREEANKQNFAEAIGKFEGIIKLDPFDENVFNQIGWCYLRQGDLATSEEFARKALSVGRNDGSYNLLASIYNDKGYPDLSVENYKMAISLSESESSKMIYLSNMALAYFDLKEYVNARSVIEQAIAIDTADTFIWKVKGQFYLETNNIDSAIYSFDKATQLKKMSDYLQESLYSDLSESLFTKAKSLQKNKPQKDSLLNQSKIYILKALELNPNNLNYHSNLGLIKNLLKDGD